MRKPGLQELSVEVAEALVETLKRWRRLTAYLNEMADDELSPQALMAVEAYIYFHELRDEHGFSSEELMSFAQALVDGFEGNDEPKTETSSQDDSSDDIPF